MTGALFIVWVLNCGTMDLVGYQDRLACEGHISLSQKQALKDHDTKRATHIASNCSCTPLVVR